MKELKLTNSGKICIVDDDFNHLGTVFMHGQYVKLHYAGRTMKVHQYVMPKAPEGYSIDHIDRNPLNNQRSNLRYLTPKDQRANQGAYKYSRDHVNVNYKASANLWRAYKVIDGKQKHIGYYKTKELAIEGYKLWQTNLKP